MSEGRFFSVGSYPDTKKMSGFPSALTEGQIQRQHYLCYMENKSIKDLANEISATLQQINFHLTKYFLVCQFRGRNLN